MSQWATKTNALIVQEPFSHLWFIMLNNFEEEWQELVEMMEMMENAFQSKGLSVYTVYLGKKVCILAFLDLKPL